jgi:hypothetical protein
MSEFAGLMWQTPWYGLTALAIGLPLLIHLLSEQRAKTVEFAASHLLSATPAKPRSELRLSQWLLLLLRILLLLMAALLLAQPHFATTQQPKAVYLVSADWLTQANEEEKTTLLRALHGQSAILLDSPAAQPLTLQADVIQSYVPQPTVVTNVFAKLASHAQNLSQGSTMHVYVTNRAQFFSTTAFYVPHTVEWHILDLSQRIKQTSPYSLQLMLVTAEDRSLDAQFVKGALHALSLNTRWQISLDERHVKTGSDGSLNNKIDAHDTNATLDAILWLSNQSLPPQILQQVNAGASLIIDAAQANTSQAWQANLPGLMGKFGGQQLGTRPATELEAWHPTLQWQILWHTDKQQPLLEHARFGQGNIWRFNSRFNPTWSGITHQASFALQLGEWVSKNAIQGGGLTLLNPQQIMQVEAVNEGQIWQQTPTSAAHFQSLHTWLWTLMVWLFCAERCVAAWTYNKSLFVVNAGRP